MSPFCYLYQMSNYFDLKYLPLFIFIVMLSSWFLHTILWSQTSNFMYVNYTQIHFLNFKMVSTSVKKDIKYKKILCTPRAGSVHATKIHICTLCFGWGYQLKHVFGVWGVWGVCTLHINPMYTLYISSAHPVHVTSTL